MTIVQSAGKLHILGDQASVLRATPRADPSTGSVPVPTSSSSTRDLLSDAALTACKIGQALAFA
ncbi:MAG: hypothetical protein FRX49_00052 [Trebouxia sp. A1-2]|nr:MAG: hypothetical protein FRX49_00052 [Trebouxia sp. A1-2]